MQSAPTAVNRKARVRLRGACVIIDALTPRDPIVGFPSFPSPGREAPMSASREDELEAVEEEGVSL